jgi:hypothetical protein
VSDRNSGRRPRPARRADFVGNARTLADVLLAVECSGERWSACVWLDQCPSCGHAHLMLAIDSAGEPRLYCGGGCDLAAFLRALPDGVIEARRAA